MRDPDWRRDLDERRGAPGPAHPIVLAVVQWLIAALHPRPIRRRLYPMQAWALLNHYQHECRRVHREITIKVPAVSYQHQHGGRS